MAEEAKKKQPGQTFYSIGSLNRWFLISCGLMTLTYFWSILEDHYKPWKQFQREFLDLEWLAAESEAAGIWSDKENRSLGELFDELDQAQAQISTDPVERPKLAAALQEAEFQFALVNADMKQAKADFEADRFHYEEYAHHEGEADMWKPQQEHVQEALAHYQDLRSNYNQLDEDNKAAEAAMNAAKDRLADYDRVVTSVQTRVDNLEREVGALERSQTNVDTSRFFTTFRNSVFFDFMQPNVKVNKIVTKELFQELNFLQMPRIDMCTTCHQASDRFQDYPWDNPPWFLRPEDDPEGEVEARDRVFLAHPRPELFATALSPHSQERFGCSGCHQGNGQRVNFELTWHTPSDEEEKERWREDYHWHEPHYWDNPMVATPFIESSCYKCHSEEVHITGADTWNRGRDLVQRYGCYGCHNMEPFAEYRKAGPSLKHIVSKYQTPEWAFKWVQRPESFRPSTPMPQFFHLENKVDDPVRQDAEIAAIVTYLYNLATPLELEPYPGNGDAARGQALFGADGGVGCLACHNIDDYQAADLTDTDLKDTERHGPELSGVGSKVSGDWLFNWLQDPQAIWPDTNMPNLRLTRQEAADLTAYLMSKRNLEFEDQVFERPEGEEIYNQILVEKFTERMTEARAREEVAAMSALNRRLMAGEYLVNHHGCFGCHDIAGYEAANPIGTELNGWGSKHQDRLDFGVFEMDWKAEGKFNREDWLTQKLQNPRFFDRGKDRKPFEQLKMPQFDFGDTDAEAKENLRAVMTFVLSLSNDPVAESIQRHLTAAEEAVERGRQLVDQKNCYGCHELYGRGGEIRSFIGDEDTAAAFHPPLLNGQGARTQHDWLFAFLTDPVLGGDQTKAHLRPWMKARMPTFGFTQDQLNDLVAYFAHEEVWHTANDHGIWDSVLDEFRDNFTGYDDRSMRRADGGKQMLYQTLLARQYRSRGGSFLHQTDFPYLSTIETELPASDGSLAKGFFSDLKCVQCHMPGGRPPAGKSASDMAPSLDLTAARLQPKWVENWFKGPILYQPGTRMTNFWEKKEDGTRDGIHPEIQNAQTEIELMRDYLFSGRFPKDYDELTSAQGGQ